MLDTNEVRRKVGLRIRVRRTELQMKQSELAEKTGFIIQHISKFERGVARLGIDQLVKIADALDCSPSYLLKDYENPKTAA